MKQVIIRETDVSLERLNGEVILISFENGKYYNAKGSAADVIFLIKHGVNVENWTNILKRFYKNLDVENNGIENFILKGIKENIFEYFDEFKVEDLELPLDLDRKDWVIPKLDVYEDFQDLLMVDPIHDTTEEGWPKLNDQ